MSRLPDAPPHIVVDKLLALAKEHGYFFRTMQIVYYDGIDEYLTEVKRLESFTLDGEKVT